MPENNRPEPEWQGEITKSAQIQEWYAELAYRANHARTPYQRSQAAKSVAKIDRLIGCVEQFGPNLRRPLSDMIKRDTPGIVTMYELRGQNPDIRIIYAFDHRSDAVLLYGWDKAEDSLWKKGYKPAIAFADRLYDEYLATKPVTRIPTRHGKRKGNRQ